MTQDQNSELDRKICSRECKYSLVMAVVGRAKELNRIARERNLSVKEVSYSDLDISRSIPLALDEILTDKVKIVIKKRPAVQPEPIGDTYKSTENLLNAETVFPAVVEGETDSSSKVEKAESGQTSAGEEAGLSGLPNPDSV